MRLFSITCGLLMFVLAPLSTHVVAKGAPLHIRSTAVNTEDCRTHLEAGDREHVFTCYPFFSSLLSYAALPNEHGSIDTHPLFLQKGERLDIQEEDVTLPAWERLRSVHHNPEMKAHLQRIEARKQERYHRRIGLVFDDVLTEEYNVSATFHAFRVLDSGVSHHRQQELLIVHNGVYAWDALDFVQKPLVQTSPLAVMNRSSSFQDDGNFVIKEIALGSSFQASVMPSATQLSAPVVFDAQAPSLRADRSLHHVSACKGVDATVLFIVEDNEFTCEENIFSMQDDAIQFQLSSAFQLAPDSQNPIGGPH